MVAPKGPTGAPRLPNVSPRGAADETTPPLENDATKTPAVPSHHDDVYADSTEPEASVPPLRAGVPNQRGDQFFSGANALREVRKLPHGFVLAMPFHGYVVDYLDIANVAELGPVKELLAGTGYVPVTTQNGKAIVHLTVADYKDSSAGPYLELGLHIIATKPDAAVPIDVSNDVGKFAALTSNLSPHNSVFSTRLILQVGRNAKGKLDLAPVIGGREIVGLDKQAGQVRMETKGNALHFSVLDERGQPVVEGAVTQDQGKAFGQLGALAQVFGFEDPRDLATLPATAPISLINRDVKSKNELVRSTLQTKSSGPALFELAEPSDYIKAGNSEIGSLIARMKLQPLASVRQPTMMMVLDEPTERVNLGGGKR